MPVYYNLYFEPPVPDEIASYLDVLLYEEPGNNESTHGSQYMLGEGNENGKRTVRMTGCTELDLQDMTDRLTALIRFWEIDGYVITGRILCFTGPEDLVYLYIRKETCSAVLCFPHFLIEHPSGSSHLLLEYFLSGIIFYRPDTGRRIFNANIFSLPFMS